MGGGGSKHHIHNVEQQLQNTKNSLDNIIAQQKKDNEKIRAENIENIARYEEKMKNLAGENEKKMEIIAQQRKQDNEKYMEELKKAEECNREEMNHMKMEALNVRLKELENFLETLKKPYQHKCEETLQLKKQVEEMRDQCKIEEKHIEQFEEELKDESIIKVVLLGKTGHGKSLFANRLNGDKSKSGSNGIFKVSPNATSETSKIQKVLTQNIYGKKLSVVDTPGIFDSEGRDRIHMNNLVNYLRGCGGVNAFVILKSYGDLRLDICYQDMLKGLEQMLGKTFWHHVVFVLTRINTENATIEDMGDFNDYCRNLKYEIKKQLHLNDNDNINLPIIPIDNNVEKSYTKQIANLIDIIPSKKFQCLALQSPLSQLKIELNTLTQTYESCKSEQEGLDNQIKITQRQIQECRQHLHNQGGLVNDVDFNWDQNSNDQQMVKEIEDNKNDVNNENEDEELQTVLLISQMTANDLNCENELKRDKDNQENQDKNIANKIDGWYCKHCTFLNHKDMVYCEECSRTK